MNNILYGALIGWASLLLVAQVYADGKQEQCEQDHIGKKCELLWVETVTK